MIAKKKETNPVDLICLSHLRWGFVFQRPQHLMSRFAKTQRVYFVEEPVFEDREESLMRAVACPKTGVVVVTPALPDGHRGQDFQPVLKRLLNRFMSREKIERYIAWFYTPMALDFTSDLTPEAIIYDCMDELSLFRGAPARLCENETKLLKKADLVFAGGVSLFEAKRKRHARVYPFPSGVDVAHFAQARGIRKTAQDQENIPCPRIGYAGVIDERIDLELLDRVAAKRPDWSIVMLGPVVKIDPATLPQRPNLHWLGMKDYQELPRYFAGWDAAILPFAVNDSTRYISPTKTPEYLAAGLPVVSTPIRDVVRPYGDLGLARIAGNCDDFVTALELSMTHGLCMKWRERADVFLRTLSWDDRWDSMSRLIEEVISAKTTRPAAMAAGSSTMGAGQARGLSV
jgi:UDP-galactopyranose mutase